jgi:basic amino acid/polyamine antiporter, APA family
MTLPEYGDGLTLKRVLSAGDLVFLGVGAVAGTGIYTLLIPTIRVHTGPAVPLSFLFAAVSCLFSALCYAELASMVRVTGSAYTYSHAALGELVGWVVGWDLILEYVVAAAAAASSWSLVWHPMAAAAGIGSARTAWPDLTAALVVVCLMAVTLVGIRESSRANTGLVLVKLAVLVLFIALGARAITLANLTPFIPPGTGRPGEFGWWGVFRGAGILYFAYLGFDAVALAAEESRNPHRDIPIGILGTLLLTTVIYGLFSLVLVGSVHYSTMDPSLTASYHSLFPGALGWILSIGTLFGLSSVLIVTLGAQARLLYAISRDGLLPASFAGIHRRFRTPVASTLCTGTATALLAAFVPLKTLAEITSVGTLLAFLVVCVSVVVLRSTQPDRPRPFRVPWLPAVALAGVLSNLGLMYALGYTNLLRLAVWMAIGLVIYVCYGRRHAIPGRASPDTP